ncbi:MAG: PTS transporter subunit EIIC [Bryobacteraceae bacterium]
MQKVGGFMAGMVIPNIGAFIAWGLITALFLPAGWFPNPRLARLIEPMILNLLPILIGYTGGRLVHGVRGGLVGAVSTMGMVAGSTVPMFIGAMTMGPFSAWLLKQFDERCGRRAPMGFEMLVNNFSAGILGMGMALAGFTIAGPFVAGLTAALSAGARKITSAGYLPLIALFIEPGKVLFINNAIHHGVLAPLGVAEARQLGKSIIFLLEPNPGQGAGLLCAYWLFGKGTTRSSAPGALLIHLFGGIHELYFPFVLMNPLTVVAMIAGGCAAAGVFTAMHAGLVATWSPGSVFTAIALAPKGGLLPVLCGIATGAVVTFLVAAPIVKRASPAQPGAEQFRLATEPAAPQPVALPAAIYFVCEAGMGSSVMGAAALRKKVASAGAKIEVTHKALSELPPGAEMVVCQRSLAARVSQIAPQARIYPVDDYVNSPAYDQVLKDLGKGVSR